MASTAGKRGLVVGVGNEYRGDDAVGYVIVRRLRSQFAGRVDIREYEGDGAGLMQMWAGFDFVVIVDCVTSAAEPGTILRFDASVDRMPTKFFRSSSHLFGVAEAIEMARVLGQLPPTLLVFGVVGADFEAGHPLSGQVAGVVSAVVERMADELTVAGVL